MLRSWLLPTSVNSSLPSPALAPFPPRPGRPASGCAAARRLQPVTPLVASSGAAFPRPASRRALNCTFYLGCLAGRHRSAPSAGLLSVLASRTTAAPGPAGGLGSDVLNSTFAPVSPSPYHPHRMTHGQDKLVQHLVRSRELSSQRIIDALLRVDRKNFVSDKPENVPDYVAYADHPLSIGYGQTISAPHMHAYALSLLDKHLQPGARVLDVGSGSGYLTAAIGHLVAAEGGTVLGVEKHKELAERSMLSIRRDSPELLEGDQPTIKIMPGNVLSDLLKNNKGEFHAIHVGAAAAELPQVLVDALHPGGRMVIPVGPQDGHQVLMVYDKNPDGTGKIRELMGVRYVPLTEPQ